MTEAEGAEVVRRLLEMEKSGDYQPATVNFGPYAAFVTISALQLACRHPEVSPPLRQALEEIARGIQSFFGGSPGELLEAGWNPSLDVPGGPR